MENKNIDIESLLKSKVDEVANKNKEEEKSPLELLQERQQSPDDKGLIINKSEFTNDDAKTFDGRAPGDDRRDEEFNEYLNDMDSKIDAAKNLNVKRKPTNALEMAAMIEELDDIAKGDKKESDTVSISGKEVDRSKFDSMIKKDIPIGNTNIFFDKKDNTSIDNNEIDEEVGDSSVNETDEEKQQREINEKKDALVSILIDKTGIPGSSRIEFSDEEREKLTEATEIKLINIESLELETLDFVEPTKGFTKSITDNDPGIGNTIVTCVSSGYRATMRGAGYGALGDLIINPQTASFDKYNKTYSVIYNCLVNTTVGKFNSYEEFLKNTSWIDMNVLLYGMIVSTFPNIDTVQLTCQKCKKSFDHKYLVSTLFDLKDTSYNYLTKFKELVDGSAENYNNLYENSAVHRSRMFKLPHSKWVITCGISSAYDYLHKKVSNANDIDEWMRKHPDDTNGLLYANADFISVVRAVAREENGKYVRYTEFEDIITAIYSLPVDDIPILNTILTKYYDDYDVHFSIRDTKCPHCNTVSERSNIDLYQLVFLKLQQLMSIQINTEILPSL